MPGALKLKYSWQDLGYALLLLVILQGNLFLKLAVIGILMLFNIELVLPNKANRAAVFYFYIISVILISVFSIGWLHPFNYIYSLIFSLVIWLFCLFLFNFNNYYVQKNSFKSLYRSLDILFWVNIIISFGQLAQLMIEQRTINPFGGTHKGATGDYISGIFSNSSINMIVSALFFFFYYQKRWIKKAFIAGITALLTTYMGGLMLAVSAFLFVLLLSPKIKLKLKLLGLSFILIGYLSFLIISPENVTYVSNYIKITLSQHPPRKIISFVETFHYSTSNFIHFFVGAGPGNFSSRTAFVTGGEYVSWLPEKMVYRSKAFTENHFQLWNNKILSMPFQDGSANQPFSLYNQLPGEYGLIGILMFVVFYVGYYLKNYYRLSYGKYLLVFMLLIFLMDYWFEYLSVVVLFEILMLLQLKEIKEENENTKP